MIKKTHTLIRQKLLLVGLIFLTAVFSYTCKRATKTQPEASKQAPVEAKSTTPLEKMPKGFCLLKDSVPDAVLDIRYASSYNFVGKQIDGYEAPVALITQQAASALRKVSKELNKKGYRLKIYDAYRPQRAVDHFLRWAKDPSDTLMKSVFYPHIQKSTIFSRGYVARKSTHTRGSTLDLTLVDISTGKDVDMGGSFDFFGGVSHTLTDKITGTQQQNRLILRDAMVRHGFKPVQGEWWHFTLRNEPYPNTYFDFPVKKYR